MNTWLSIDVEQMRQRYEYDADNECLINKIEGTTVKLRRNQRYGYARIFVEGIGYALHRIVWAIVHGVDPGDMPIDHIDRDKNNNTIDNLRRVSHSENGRNRVCTYDAPPMVVTTPAVAESHDDISDEDRELMEAYTLLTSV